MNALAINALMSLSGFGPKTVRTILQALPGAPNSPSDLRLFISEAAKRNARIRVPPLSEVSDAFESSEVSLARSNELGVSLIGIDDADYPARLLRVEDAPLILYVLGDKLTLSDPVAIALIGTREPSSYGSRMAFRLGQTFARANITVISGLALGCDARGQEGCVQAGGRTVAVLAHGLHMIYPAQHRDLAHRIVDSGGSLVSEYAVGVKPQRSSFIERDRLQSGLSDGVLVVETDIQGGTMHTVGFCIAQERKLACLHHPPEYADTPKSNGNRYLVAERGAFEVSDVSDLQRYIAQVSTSVSQAPVVRSTSPAGQNLSLFADFIGGQD